MDWLWGAELQTKRPGRKVIVAGSAMGIGLGSVEELCKSGFSVIACDINEDGLSKSFSSTNNTRPQWPSPGSVLPVVADVAKPEEMLEKVKHCNGNTLDDIWGYAAIAGIGFYAPTLLLSIDSIKKAFDGTIRALLFFFVKPWPATSKATCASISKRIPPWQCSLISRDQAFLSKRHCSLLSELSSCCLLPKCCPPAPTLRLQSV